MGFHLLSEDLLEKILSKLPAISLASAACVCKLWFLSSNHILSRPKLASALSFNPSLDIAVQEALDKVLSEPIRPHFAIANGVGDNFDLEKCCDVLAGKLGSRTPLIVTCAGGIMGRDAVTNEFREVMAGDDSRYGDGAASNEHVDFTHGFLLTVGFVPGLKVDAIPFSRSQKQHAKGSPVDNFVMDIRNYMASVSASISPAGIIMFGDENSDLKPIIEKLDYALPKETVIVGDQKTEFCYKSKIESRNKSATAVALVFAKDREKCHGIGEIQFHAALSNGVSAIGPRYKAASVRMNASDCTTWLTARREGEHEILDGQSILNGINDELENLIGGTALFIGVSELRKCSIGTEKSTLMSSLVFHGIMGGDEEYLYVYGIGIRTADYFQFYHANPSTALASSRNVSIILKNLKLDWSCKRCLNSIEAANESKTECIGGFIFSCCGRGEPFFGCANTEGAPFLENFPGIPLSGIFCGGEIGRGCSILNANQDREESLPASNLHVFSSVYLVLSYTPARLHQ